MKTRETQSRRSVQRMVRRISDCGQDGCGKCDVCRYLAFIEEAQSVAPEGSIIQRDSELEKYIAATYSPNDKLSDLRANNP